MRILICEDHPEQLDWLLKRLHHHGHRAHGTMQGDQAFWLWQRQEWDWVITDYNFIPGQRIKNGLYLIHTIHAIDSEQKIILQTGAHSLDVPRGVKLLPKPYPIRSLLRLLNEPATGAVLLFPCPKEV